MKNRLVEGNPASLTDDSLRFLLSLPTFNFVFLSILCHNAPYAESVIHIIILPIWLNVQIVPTHITAKLQSIESPLLQLPGNRLVECHQ